MRTEAQRKATNNYRKKLKSMSLEFYPNDDDIVKKLETVPAKTTYIKELIRKDIAENG